MMFVIAASLLLAQTAPQVGDTHEITRRYETAEKTNADSTGSSSGHTGIVERVIAVRDTGIELEYDLPDAAGRDRKGPEWQFPFRVFKPFGGPAQLLGRAELEKRVTRWLKRAKWPRKVCGSWYFTWNAFQVECDPESAMRIVEAYTLGPDDLRDGGSYRDPDAIASVPVHRSAADATGGILVAEAALDPERFRRQRAEADVIVAGLLGKTLTLDAAMRERAGERISGTITITFHADAGHRLQRRDRVTSVEIAGPGDTLETRTATETLIRRKISP